MNFSGKVAVITGAGHGIGRTIAMRFASAGAAVAVTDINAVSGQQVVDAIRNLGQEATYLRADLRREDELSDLFDAVGKRYGKIDVLVNNARPKLRVADWTQTLDEWDLAMDVLLKAPAIAAKLALPWLRKAKAGSIINISSTNGTFVSHQPPAYHAAKAGLHQLTRYLACVLGPEGIRANALCPGLVDIFDDNRPLTSNPLNKKITEIAVPMRRASTTDEIANAVLFLASENASYMNGQIIELDGGITLGDHFHIARAAFLAGAESQKE